MKFWSRGRRFPKSPPVKKASQYISRSHKPKRYISLMLVPSYSGGKTRSLQLPRHIFISISVFLIVVTLSIAGFYLRSVYHRNIAANLSIYLYETQEALIDVMEETVRLQEEITDSVNELHERHLEERRLQERRHMYALEDIWDLIEEIEKRIDDLRGERLGYMEEMRLASFIPVVAERFAVVEALEHELKNGFDRVTTTVGTLANPNPLQIEIVNRLLTIEMQLQTEEVLLRELRYRMQDLDLYVANFPTIKPATGIITSNFGMRSTIFVPSLHMHHGIDIAAPTGTPIFATGGGMVTFSGWHDGGYGFMVVIDHGIGIQTLYAHNSRNLVRVGDEVERGQRIALMGSTGRSTGPHVHYEVIVGDVRVDPNQFFLMDWER